MEFLKIKIKPDLNENIPIWKKKNAKIVLFLLAIGSLNIVSEFFIRRIFNTSLADSLVESSHILIYFIVPSLYSLRNTKAREYFYMAGFFVLGSLLYALTEHGLIDPLFNLFFVPLLLLMLYYFQKRGLKERLLINFSSPKDILGYFALSAFLIGGHLFFVVSLSQNYSFQNINIYHDLPKFIYMAFGMFGTEIFFRGFIFNRLNRELKIPFWIAASLSTLLFIGPFFTNPVFTSDISLLASIVFYLLLLGFVFCALTKKTRSIIPSYLLSLLMAILRYLIILGTI